MVRTLIDHGAGPFCVQNTRRGKRVFVESLRHALGRFFCDQEVLECLLTREPYSLMRDWSESLTETLFVSHNRGYHSIERLLLRRMELLINNLGDPNVSTTVEELDDVFVAACGYRQLALVKVLIEHNILQASNKISQAFEAAVRSGCDEMVRTLLDSGVGIDQRFHNLSATALMVASEEGHANLVDLLLHNGAEVSSQCIALHLAAGKGHAAIVQMLLDAGADPNIRHEYSHDEPQWGTALHMAARCGSAQTVRVLLDHATIDANVLNGCGEHAIQTASEWGCVDCLQLLLERDVPLEHLNNVAAMAMKFPSSGKSGEILHMLVAKGATAPLPYLRSE